MSNASFYSKCPWKWKRKWEIYISASHTSHYYQAVESISIQVFNLQTNSCSRYFSAPPPHQLGKLSLQLTRVVRCQIFYTKTNIKINFDSPMKTLKFLVIVVTFLDGDICGHFVGVQSAPCSGLSPQSCSRSVSTSVSVSASVSQPLLTELDKITQHQRSVQVFFRTWNYLDLQQSVEKTGQLFWKHSICYCSTLD